MNLNFSLLLQAQQPGGGMMFPILMVGMIVVMYFFMIRPQQKKAKEAKAFAQQIKTGDKIVTSSGIHGRIVKDNTDGTIGIEIGRNTEITIERNAVSMEMTQALAKRNNPTSNTTK